MQAYANSYKGNAKINRLVFISEKTADAGLALSALRIAAEELKKVLGRLEHTTGQYSLRTDISIHASAFCAAGPEHLPV